jgi:hypothetical protein
MNNFEFISYKPYPNDQYTKSIATIRIDKKFVVKYAEKSTKTGQVFWAPATHSLTENGEKKYESSFMMDSRCDEELLLEFIRSHVNAEKRKTSNPMPTPQPVAYPHGLCQPSHAPAVQADFFAGVGESQEQIPF